MVAQETPTPAAALLFDRAEHVRQVARVVSGIRHDARAQDIGFGFVFPAVLQEGRGKGNLSYLSKSRPTQNSSQNTRDSGASLILRGLCCLGRAMTQGYVAQLVRHYAGHLAFGPGGLDHSAVHIHRAPRLRERINVARVDDFEVITKLGVLKLGRDRGHQTLSDSFAIVSNFRVA